MPKIKITIACKGLIDCLTQSRKDFNFKHYPTIQTTL